jgi:aryl-alcohol dehydrogenase-like predicted oxidoreductase
MKYRNLGKTDLLVSEIGLGCQSIGGGLYYKDHKESLRTLFEAFDSGVNFFDTSDHYSQGESEKLIGEAFSRKRDKIMIGTKAGTLYTKSGSLLLRIRSLFRPVSKFLEPMKIPFHLMRAKQKRFDFSSEYLIKAVEKSLQRLKTDYIDLFQLHKPPKHILARGDFIETLERLVEQGKIRYYGISTADNEDAFNCFEYPKISSVQITINLLEQKSVPGILKLAKDKGVGIIARNPRSHGHLTDGLGDIMAETYAQNKKEFNLKMDKAAKYRFLVNPNRTLAQAALRYVLNLDGISTVIPRAINRRQLAENLGTLNSPYLSNEELAIINTMQDQEAH